MIRTAFSVFAIALFAIEGGFAAAGASSISSAVGGATSISSGIEWAYAPVYGKSLPPIGFVEFCARNRSQCEKAGSSRRAAMNDAFWQKLRQVNSEVNSSIEPVSDQDLYAVPERWDYPAGAGDCEDYVLLKKRYLEDIGFPSESLLITVVLDEIGEGHAVLTVTTTEGDYVLDNRRNEILPWSATSYRFLKRQSQEDPRVWIALSEAGRTSIVEAANRNPK